MEKAYQNDIYSSHFNSLFWLGLWDRDCDGMAKMRLSFAYRCLMMASNVSCIVLMISDLYLSRGNFRQISFNLSTNLLCSLVIVKMLYVSLRADEVNEFRRILFRDAWMQTEPEEIEAKQHFKNILIKFRRIFFACAFTIVPIWLISSLLTLVWGPRRLPFPIWLPFNLDNDIVFFLTFCYHAVASIIAALGAIHVEFSFYVLILQISAQINVLVLKVNKIGRKYLESTSVSKVVRENRVKKSLQKCIHRHLELTAYIKKLEQFYSTALVLGLLLSLFLITFNSYEALKALTKINLKWYYQVCYTVLIIIDVLIATSLGNVLLDESKRLSDSIYELPWYEISPKLRKDILFILINTQRYSPICGVKLFKLEINTFVWEMKSISSLLALLWQFNSRNID